jgi:hypothetical protein
MQMQKPKQKSLAISHSSAKINLHKTVSPYADSRNQSTANINIQIPKSAQKIAKPSLTSQTTTKKIKPKSSTKPFRKHEDGHDTGATGITIPNAFVSHNSVDYLDTVDNLNKPTSHSRRKLKKPNYSLG